MSKTLGLRRIERALSSRPRPSEETRVFRHVWAACAARAGLSTTGLADVFGVCPQTIRDWVTRGEEMFVADPQGAEQALAKRLTMAIADAAVVRQTVAKMVAGDRTVMKLATGLLTAVGAF